jgi:hypothetical protein
MNTPNEIIIALAKGYKIRKTYWGNYYIYIKDDKIIDSEGQEYFMGVGDFIDDEWELYSVVKE